MSNLDPVSDLLTRIRNAHLAKHDRVDVPTSKLKAEICRILMAEGFIRNYRVLDEKPRGVIRIFLDYDESGSPTISHLRRVSKPGRRVYRGAGEIPPILGGRGLGVVSTNLGLLSDAQAREKRIGGELLCEVW